MDQELFSKVDRYIETLFAPHDDILEEVRQSMYKENLPQIAVSPAQGQLLHVLALLCNASNILEIGTLAGYSTIWMARALPSQGRLTTLEYDQKHARLARQNIARAGLSDKVEVRQGAALEILQQLYAERSDPFDMIFVDADKSGYVDYFEWSLRLSRPGTLLVFDNVIRQGKVLDPTSSDLDTVGVERLNGALAISHLVSAVALQTVGIKGHDGLALAVVKP